MYTTIEDSQRQLSRGPQISDTQKVKFLYITRFLISHPEPCSRSLHPFRDTRMLSKTFLCLDVPTL